MLTIWANVVVFAIALGHFFFKGAAWDRYATVVLIVSLVPLVARFLRGQIASRTSREVEQAEPRREAEETAQQRIDAVQKRLRKLAPGHAWCRTL